jgi:DNA-binding response OmpR family regulator
MAKIVIIEDDRVLNSAYQMILEKEGHTVTTAFEGQEGLDKVKDFKPDIILLDLLMPTMGGISFLEEYDVAKNHPEVKVIVLSNMGDEQLVEKARELGTYKYIVKAHTTPGQLSVMVNHIANSIKEKAKA